MVFFLGFVFFIVIVLMNLLNALAVADAKEMLEDADLEMLHGLLTTVAFWEKVVQGDPGNRLRWCLLPLKDMVGSSWWPVRPATLSVLSPTPVLRFLPKTNKTWKDEFPNDVFWLCQVRPCLQKLLFHSNSKFLFSSVIHCLNKCLFHAMKLASNEGLVQSTEQCSYFRQQGASFPTTPH